MSRFPLLRSLLILGALQTIHSAQAQTVDPALAKPWAFMQQSMPGVSYDLLKAACAEGTLTIYHGTWTEAQEAQVAAFKERFPCMNVRLFVQATTARRERFLSELRAGRNIADIIQDSDPGVLDQQASDGILMNYTISNDASYEDGVKKKGFWYPLRIGITANAWNTNLVSDEDAKILFDWKGIADPRWKGRSAIDDVGGGGTNFLPFYVFEKMYGKDFMNKIGANKPRIFTSNNVAISALASGEVAVVFAVSDTPLVTMQAQGATIKWAMPEPGIGAATGQAISAQAPHPNAAKLYQEYAFTEEGYGAWQKLGGAPARSGYKDQRSVASESWYKYPQKFYAYDTGDASNSFKAVVEDANAAIGTAH